MKTISSFIFLLTAIILIAACTNTKPVASSAGTESNALNGTWELNYITGPRIAFQGLYPEQKPSLVFNLPSLEIGGHTSCNPFSTNITLEGYAITFADGRSTMMACPGQGEQLFLNTLKKINRYNVSGDTTLTLIMGDIAMMRFVKK